VRPSYTSTFLSLFVAVHLAGCDGVAITTLYESELDLCLPENAEIFAMRVAECRARFLSDGSCAGVMSFSGTLADEPVAVETELEQARILEAELPDLSVVRDELELYGESPYFRFVFVLYMLGGATDLGETNRTLDVGGALSHPAGWSSDALMRTDLRITAPPDSLDFPLTAGNIVITTQSLTESAGRFSFSRGAPSATELDGCFHAFTTDRSIAMELP